MSGRVSTCTAPQLLGATFDRATGRFVIVLEDLGATGAVFCDTRSRLRAPDARGAGSRGCTERPRARPPGRAGSARNSGDALLHSSGARPWLAAKVAERCPTGADGGAAPHQGITCSPTSRGPRVDRPRAPCTTIRKPEQRLQPHGGSVRLDHGVELDRRKPWSRRPTARRTYHLSARPTPFPGRSATHDATTRCRRGSPRAGRLASRSWRCPGPGRRPRAPPVCAGGLISHRSRACAEVRSSGYA